MAKSLLRLKAIELRGQGTSVRDIARELDIPKSTVSGWVREVILTVEQLERIQKKWLKGSEKGRSIGAFKQKQARLDKITLANETGIKNFAHLTKRELLIAGLAIYASEGSKKSHELRFCNSDPKIIIFMVRWLKICFQIPDDRIKCYVGINEAHKERDEKVKKFWSDRTKIPLNKFRKTSFKRVANKKIYENFEDHYGTLNICVLRGTDDYYRILGQIQGLFQ